MPVRCAELRAAIAVAALAACGSSAPAPATPKPAENRCAYVADHLLSLLSPEAQQAPTEELDRVRATFNTRCKDDGWSTAAQQCFLELTAKEDVDRCAAQLTEAQRAALDGR
jgi:hypothetical protein